MQPKSNVELLPPLEISPAVLSSEAIEGIIENFILREGTDYGREERSYLSKRDQLLKQLQSGEIKITFDPNTETVSLTTKLQWEKINRTLNP